MQYVSTRFAGIAGPRTSFCDTLLGGLAPDKGLYLPFEYPRVPEYTLRMWSTCSYAELAANVTELFIEDIPRNDTREILNSVYTEKNFGSPEITPFTNVREGLYLQDLSGGPTLAFKDQALQLLGALFDYQLRRTGQKMNILGATSGDTGSAAEHGMLGKESIFTFMLSPAGRMSRFQTAQMYSIFDPRVFNLSVDNTFDYCQALVKAVMADAEFKKKYSIGAVNSINWARILAQVVYYFKGYLTLMKGKDIGKQVDFVVPSGNFGNICAGHVAKQMGLPIRRLVLATNENDVLDEFVRTGRYRVREKTLETMSPSMDICVSSNLERLIADITGRRGARVEHLFRDPKGFQLEGEELQSITGRFGFRSGKCSEEDCLKTIKEIWETYGTMIDPHTAVGMKVALDQMALDQSDKTDRIVLETAKPAKFEDAIVKATGIKPPRPKAMEGIEDRTQRSFPFKSDVSAEEIKAFIAQNALI